MVSAPAFRRHRSPRPSAAAGPAVALFQALTQIQEMTRTFVLKIAAVLLVTAFTASFIGAQIFTFTAEVCAKIAKGF